MRVLFALTIAAAFALPISAQAGHGGGGGGGGGGGSKAAATNAASKQTTTGTSTSVRKAAGHAPVEYVKKSTGGSGGSNSSSGSGSSKVNPTPKPAAKGDTLLKLEGIGGESKDDDKKP